MLNIRHTHGTAILVLFVLLSYSKFYNKSHCHINITEHHLAVCVPEKNTHYIFNSAFGILPNRCKRLICFVFNQIQ